MKILVIAFNDADNLVIENVLREMKRRGHEITIFAPFQDDNSLRMFQVLNVEIRPIEELNNNVTSQYDVAFLTNMTMQYAKLLDIYCFAYSSYIDETFMPNGADFLFTYRGNCWPRISYHCASMPVGDPKNDNMEFHPAENTKRILFIDSGHVPFGIKGKTQIADMILDICARHPDYEICIKPRWLRKGSVHYTHENTSHLYTVIEDRCGNHLPKNLNMLNEHYDLSELIDGSDCVVTLYTAAILNVVLQGKRLVIATDWDNEDKFDFRNEVEIKLKKALYSESGCAVPYHEVAKCLPQGFQPNEDFKRKMFLYQTGASRRIVDVIEYVFENFLSHKSFPAMEEYLFETFRETIHRDPKITMSVLKRERIRDLLQYSVARKSYMIAAKIDFQRYYQLVDKEYKTCTLSNAGYAGFRAKCDRLLWKTIVENETLLETDAIDQSCLLQALYHLGLGNNLLSIPPEKVLCTGAYHFFLGQYFKQKEQIDEALYHYALYLKERNSRSFEKYPCDGQKEIHTAYSYIFSMFNGDNMPLNEFTDLYITFYKKRDITNASYYSRKRAHGLLPRIAEQLTDTDPEKALACLQLYAKYEYHYNVREKNEKIQELQQEIDELHHAKLYQLTQKFKWIFKKIWGGIRCFQENGWTYTWHHAHNKVQNRINRAGSYRISLVFHERVMAGYRLYATVIGKYGQDTELCLTSPSIGDSYIFGQLFPTYSEKHYKKMKTVLIVASNSAVKAIAPLGIENVENIPMPDFLNLYNLLMFTTANQVHIVSMHYHVYYRHTAILSYLEGIHQFDFLSFCIAYLGVDANAYLTNDRPYHDENLYPFIKKLEEHDMLPLGQTVLLVPYTRSIPPLPKRFWNRLAIELKNRGLCVYTNTGGDWELPIEGTMGICVPLDELCLFTEKAGAIIGLRSGMLDITSRGNCLQISICPANKHRKSALCTIDEFFSLEKMYGRCNKFDTIYMQENETETINRIIALVDVYIKNKAGEQ